MNKNNAVPAQMTRDVKDKIKCYPSLRAAARDMGFSASYLSLVMKGLNPAEKLAKFVGWRKKWVKE